MNKPFRSNTIDMLRGLAVFMMVLFHFCFDLTHFGYIEIDFHYDPFWLNFRTLIVSLFVTIAGISLSLARYNQTPASKAIKRLWILLACSLMITLVSYFLFPGKTIVFGILHFITVASIIGIFFSYYPLLSLLAGIILLVLGNTVSLTLFDQPWLHWIGLMTIRPMTEDYVPLLPWLGAMLCGISIGYFLLRNDIGTKVLQSGDLIPGSKVLSFAGKHSLMIYMLHQPVLFGALSLL